MCGLTPSSKKGHANGNEQPPREIPRERIRTERRNVLPTSQTYPRYVRPANYSSSHYSRSLQYSSIWWSSSSQLEHRCGDWRSKQESASKCRRMVSISRRSFGFLRRRLGGCTVIPRRLANANPVDSGNKIIVIIFLFFFFFFAIRNRALDKLREDSMSRDYTLLTQFNNHPSISWHTTIIHQFWSSTLLQAIHRKK